MHAVEVTGIVARVADKKLGTTCVPSGMGHGEHAPVVVLIVSIELTFDGIAGAAHSVAVGTTALDYKIGNHSVKGKAVVDILLWIA